MKFKNNDKYIVIAANKNLDPCILEQSKYINRAIIEHLGNPRN